MVDESTAARSAGSREDVHAKVSALARGTGRTVAGHRVDRTQADRFRVGLRTPSGRDTKVYGSAEHAAQAIHEGQHHDAGTESAFRKVTGSKPDITKMTTEEMQQHLNAGKITTGEIVAEMERRGKIRTEAENKARLPGGAETRYDKPFHKTNEPAEYLRKLRGGAPPTAEGTPIPGSRSQLMDLYHQYMAMVADAPKGSQREKDITTRLAELRTQISAIDKRAEQSQRTPRVANETAAALAAVRARKGRTRG
jgi:hypothetical protein